MNYKLGSLFDGSGGFPLAGALCGIEPVWASEVEPYPIAVTSTRFPNIKHLGDISKINGAEVEPVDIITFGSPCQDLSVAGKRAGLKHEANGDEETTRSGLFMEAVRIIKEMREKTNGEYPRFAVWENVPGAFSSNKGEDFRIVLEELIKIVEPNAVMPEVPQKGWAYADSYCGDGWSLAYRVFDAQYWGVPQRRRRIYLVADFRGECAREILFEREGLRGYFTEGRTPWKAAPTDVERCTGADDREGEIPYTLKIRSGVSVDSYGKAAGKGALIQENLSATLGVSQDQYLFQPVGAVAFEPGAAKRLGGYAWEDVAGTLRAEMGDNQTAVAYGISAYESNAMKSSNPHSGIYEAQTSRTIDLNGGNPACNQGGIAIVEGVAEKTCIVDSVGGNAERGWESEVAPTLKATHYKMPPCIVESAGFCTEHSAKSRSIGYEEEISPTLRAGVTPACVYSVENHPADSRVNLDESGKVQTLTSRMGTGGGNVPMVMEPVGVDCYNLCTTGNVGRTVTTASGGLNEHIPVVMETVALEGNGQRPSHQGDGYAVTDKSYTLNATEKHGVVYAVDQGGGKSQANVSEGKAPTLCTTHGGEPAVAYGLDRASFNQGQNAKFDFSVTEEQQPTLTSRGPGAVAQTIYNASKASFFMRATKEGTADTLVATDYKDPQLVAFDTAHHKYIVRRLTPTECARLQGFADRWGDIEPKTDFTDAEYRFWLDVRNTHAAINGKTTKEYTKAQMLTWYNKLHTDSAEYKLWGNGIALPTALYVIQGISYVMKGTN